MTLSGCSETTFLSNVLYWRNVWGQIWFLHISHHREKSPQKSIPHTLSQYQCYSFIFSAANSAQRTSFVCGTPTTYKWLHTFLVFQVHSCWEQGWRNLAGNPNHLLRSSYKQTTSFRRVQFTGMCWTCKEEYRWNVQEEVEVIYRIWSPLNTSTFQFPFPPHSIIS